MKNQLRRRQSLMPLDVPKWIRCYDNNSSIDRYTVVYTGKYRKSIHDQFLHIGMSSEPKGFCQHSSSDQQIDVNKWGYAPTFGRKNHLGKRILFIDLPLACQQVVINDYKELWDL